MASGSVSNWEWFETHRAPSGKVASRATQRAVNPKNGYAYARRSVASLRGNYSRKASAKY